MGYSKGTYTILNEPMDPKATYFCTFDEFKDRIELKTRLPQVINKGKKRIEELRQGSSTLMLTEGKRDDVEEDDTKDETKETKSLFPTVT